MTAKSLSAHARSLREKWNSLDWNNPRVLLTAITIFMLPFVATYFVTTGLLLGLLLTISVLWLVEKSPNFIKKWIIKYPLASDLILSALAVAMIGTYFGSGLTLGLGAIFCTVFLSYSLTTIKLNPESDIEPAMSPA